MHQEGDSEFTVREGVDPGGRGFPTLAILADGQPLEAFGKAFQFGRRKAQMLFSCLVPIHEFALANGDSARAAFGPRIIRDIADHLVVEVHVDLRRDAAKGTEEPWLWLKASLPEREQIGLNARRCRAVWAVRASLEAWLLRQGQ
jgi:hypothetical protein